MAASQRCAKHNSFWIVWLFLLASRRLLILNLGQSKWKNDGLMKCISTEGPICGGFGGWFCVSPLKEGRGSGLSLPDALRTRTRATPAGCHLGAEVLWSCSYVSVSCREAGHLVFRFPLYVQAVPMLQDPQLYGFRRTAKQTSPQI